MNPGAPRREPTAFRAGGGYTRLRAPRCYAWQVDRATFSRITTSGPGLHAVIPTPTQPPTTAPPAGETDNAHERVGRWCSGRLGRVTCCRVAGVRRAGVRGWVPSTALNGSLVYRIEYMAHGRPVAKTYTSETPLTPGQMIAVDGAYLIVERVRHGIAFCKLTL